MCKASMDSHVKPKTSKSIAQLKMRQESLKSECSCHRKNFQIPPSSTSVGECYQRNGDCCESPVGGDCLRGREQWSDTQCSINSVGF